MDERAHWDDIGASYHEQIFDVFASDRNRRLLHWFDKLSKPAGTVVDFGCGTGKAFPYLSPRFARVVGVDISAQLLKEARQRPFTNVELKRNDLTRKGLSLPVADLVFSCNVIMLPQPSQNAAMFRNVTTLLGPKAYALLVVPSFESVLYAAWRMLDWYRKEGTPPHKVPAHELHYFRAPRHQLVEGIIHIDRVPTKHYLEAELPVWLSRAGLQVDTLERLEYNWDTEFSHPPDWLVDPYPWDWLIVAKRA